MQMSCKLNNYIFNSGVCISVAMKSDYFLHMLFADKLI